MCRALERKEPGHTHGLHLALQKPLELSYFSSETGLRAALKNGSRYRKVIKALQWQTMHFLWKSEYKLHKALASSLPSAPSSVGSPRGPGLFMNEPPLSCPTENTQLSAENTCSKALPSKYRNLAWYFHCLPGAPQKPLPNSKAVLQKVQLARGPGSGYGSPITHVGTHTATTHMFASTSGRWYACCMFGPCCISSDYLFFWDCWDEEDTRGQYSIEAEKHCLFTTIYILDPPHTALYLSWGHIIKGGEVCLNDSNFLPEAHFPHSGNF